MGGKSQYIYMLYKAEVHNLRTRLPIRRKASANRMDRIVLTGLNQSLSRGIVSEECFNGIKFRTLTVVDNHTR